MGRTGNSNDTRLTPGGGGEPRVELPPRDLPPIIQYKFNWSSAWIDMPEGELQSCEVSSVHGGVTRAVIKRRYGDVKLPFETDFPPGAQEPVAWLDAWLRVLLQYEGPQGIDREKIFVGRIYADTKDSLNAAGISVGDQTFTAYGPFEMLDRISVARSFWTDGAGGTLDIGWLPEINYRDNRRTLLGNRTDMEGPDGVYLYGGKALWNHRDYYEYLLIKFATQGDPLFEPQWRTAGRTDALRAIEDDIRLGNAETVGSIMRRLVNPRFGLDAVAYAYGEDFDVEEGFQLEVFPISADSYSFGGETLPRNTNTTTLAAPYAPELNITIAKTTEQSYDQIRVLGGRIVVCCSVDSTNAQEVKPGWLAADEQEYVFANVFGPGDDAEAQDAVRRNPKYADVFRKLLVDMDVWDFAAGLGGGVKLAAPKFTLEGTLVTQENAETQSTVRSTLSWTPLRENVDYSINPPVDRNGPEDEPGLLPPTAYVQNPLNAEYWTADEAGFSTRPVKDALGMYVTGSPNHKHGFLDVLDNVNFRSRHHYPQYDWRNTVLTFAFESDERIVLGFDVPPEEQRGDGSRIDIELPGAELWFLVPNTAVGVDPTTREIKRAPVQQILRDDLDRMRLVMAGAISRYYLFRSRAVLTSRGFAAWSLLPGRVLNVVDEGGFTNEVRAAITSVRWSAGEGPARTEATAGFVT